MFWINAPREVYVARSEESELTSLALADEPIRDLVERMLRCSGRRLDLSSPIVDAALSDESRLHVVTPDVMRRQLLVSVAVGSAPVFLAQVIQEFQRHQIALAAMPCRSRLHRRQFHGGSELPCIVRRRGCIGGRRDNMNDPRYQIATRFPHVRVHRAALAQIDCSIDGQTVYLQDGLNTYEQRCALAFACICLERSLTMTLDADNEDFVRTETARLLIPYEWLAEAMGLTPRPSEVADLLGVIEKVFMDRLDGPSQAEIRVLRGRTPMPSTESAVAS